jgi:hypothetical protein
MNSCVDYLTQDEIEAHEATMQQVVEDEKREQKAINDKKMMAFKAAEDESDKKMRKAKENKEEKLAAMQRDFKRLSLLRQVYHEAPDDVFELIVSKCRLWNENGWGKGGLNAFRLANKRLKQVVESCTTIIMNELEADGPDSLPIPIIQRCRRIERIAFSSHNLRSLEGCPNELKRLDIGDAPHLSDLSPLASCSIMEDLWINDSFITDITVVASMPLLEVFGCRKDPGSPSINDISPLASCPRLKRLWLYGNSELGDLSPLLNCKALEDLELTHCRLVTSLAPISSLSNLRELDCRWCPLIISLSPLSNLKNLQNLVCHGIGPQTSHLFLASCTGLKELECLPDAVDLEELRNRMPQLKIKLH